MAIIVKPFTFIPGTVIRSSEVNLDFDTLYTDYNGNINNSNIAAGAGILYSKLVPMSGDATITGAGVITVTGSGGGPPGTFNNVTLTGGTTISGTSVFNNTATFNNPVTINSTLTLSTFTPGSILFAGPGGLISQDNPNLFFDNASNNLTVGGQLLLGSVNPPTANYANRNSFIKAWVKSFVGVALDSFNVTALTFMGAGSGRYRITWTTPFANANYVVVANASFPSAGNIVCMTTNVSTTQADLFFYVGNTGAPYDASSFDVMAIGDQ